MAYLTVKGMRFLRWIDLHPGCRIREVVAACTANTAAELNAGRVAIHRMMKRGHLSGVKEEGHIRLTLTRKGRMAMGSYALPESRG